MTRRRLKKHRPEEIVAKLRDADAMLNAGEDLAAMFLASEISESPIDRWPAGHRRGAVVGGGMKCEGLKWLKHLDDENKRLKTLVADRALDIQMLKHLSDENR